MCSLSRKASDGRCLAAVTVKVTLTNGHSKSFKEIDYLQGPSHLSEFMKEVKKHLAVCYKARIEGNDAWNRSIAAAKAHFFEVWNDFFSYLTDDAMEKAKAWAAKNDRSKVYMGLKNQEKYPFDLSDAVEPFRYIIDDEFMMGTGQVYGQLKAFMELLKPGDKLVTLVQYAPEPPGSHRRYIVMVNAEEEEQLKDAIQMAARKHVEGRLGGDE